MFINEHHCFCDGEVRPSVLYVGPNANTMTNSYNIIKYSGEANIGTQHHKLQRVTQHSTFFKKIRN